MRGEVNWVDDETVKVNIFDQVTFCLPEVIQQIYLFYLCKCWCWSKHGCKLWCKHGYKPGLKNDVNMCFKMGVHMGVIMSVHMGL